MKRKLFTLLLLAAVGLSLFVSCSAAPEAVEADSDALAYVRFGEEAATRSFTATYDIQDYDNLYWFYTATKADGYGKTGETTAEVAVTTTGEGESKVPSTGLNGTIGPFSQGDWKFTLKAYAALDTGNKGQNLVYENDGEIKATLRGGETKSISATVKPSGSVGTLKFDKAYFAWDDGNQNSAPTFKIEAYGIDKKQTYILTNDESITGTNVIRIALAYNDAIAVDGETTVKGYEIKYIVSGEGENTAYSFEKDNIPVDYYNCTVTAYINGDTTQPVAISTFGFRIYGGATTVISGDITENPDSYATFDVAKTAIESFSIADTTTAQKITAKVSPSEEKVTTETSGSETTITPATEVEFAAGALTDTGSTYCLSVEALSATTASNSFEIKASGEGEDTTASAAVYGSVKLTLNAISGTTSSAVTTFNEAVTVTTYVAPNLDADDITVQYTGDGTQPTDVTYDKETGKVTFKTTHFSEFVVASKKAAPVYNKSQGRYYSSLKEAIANLGDTTELVLKSNITLSETVNVYKSVSIDLGGKTITASCRAFHIHGGDVKIDNGTIESTIADTIEKYKESSAIRVSCHKDESCTGPSTLTIGSKAVVKGNNCYGVTVFGKKDATVNVYGTIESANAALSGEGSASNTGKIILNVYDGAKLTATGDGVTYTDAVAIYQPDEDAVLNIYGGTITSNAFAAVEIRAGIANISGGTFTAGGTYSSTANGSGPTTKGAAIAVAQHTTKEPIDVVISGGKFTGEKQLAVVNPQNNKTNNVKAVVSGSDISSANTIGFFNNGTYYVNKAAAEANDGIITTSVWSGDTIANESGLADNWLTDEKDGEKGFYAYNTEENKQKYLTYKEWFEERFINTGNASFEEDTEGKTATLKIYSADLFASSNLIYMYVKPYLFEHWNGPTLTVQIDVDLDLNGKEWTPVSYTKMGSIGLTFDFNNHKIDNLKITSATGKVGLFADIANVYVKNLTIANAVVSAPGQYNVGIVAGLGTATDSITNVTVKDSSVKGKSYVGGIVGHTYGTVSKCSVINVTAEAEEQVGGIVGFIEQGGVTGCSVSNSTIKANSESAGGIGGKIYACNSSNVSITENNVTRSSVSVGSVTPTTNIGWTNNNYCGYICGGKYINGYSAGSKDDGTAFAANITTVGLDTYNADEGTQQYPGYPRNEGKEGLTIIKDNSWNAN